MVIRILPQSPIDLFACFTAFNLLIIISMCFYREITFEHIENKLDIHENTHAKNTQGDKS